MESLKQRGKKRERHRDKKLNRRDRETSKVEKKSRIVVARNYPKTPD